MAGASLLSTHGAVEFRGPIRHRWDRYALVWPDVERAPRWRFIGRMLLAALAAHCAQPIWGSRGMGCYGDNDLSAA